MKIGSQHLQFPDITAGSRSLDGVNIIYHTMDELLTKQQGVSDGHAASPVKERA
jgi:hypothetical protein